MKNKKIIVISIIILVSIALIAILTYIFLKKGNNISDLKEDSLEDILNINGYSAKLEIEVETNKNKTKYVVEQFLGENNLNKQTIIEPSNIAGVTTEYDGNTLKISNNSLGLEKVFDNYTYIVDNNLWLNSFIEDYKRNSNSKVTQKNDEIVFEVKNEEGNKYSVYKKLYIDKYTRQTY